MEINKIHVNYSTRVSLNDRFTAFSKRSRTRRDNHLQPKSSEANRKLVQRLSVKHNKPKPSLKNRVSLSHKNKILFPLTEITLLGCFKRQRESCKETRSSQGGFFKNTKVSSFAEKVYYLI